MAEGRLSAHLHFLCNEMIQPAGVDVVISEAFCLQQLNEVFNCCPEVTSDGQLLHSHHHVPEAQGKHDKHVYLMF